MNEWRFSITLTALCLSLILLSGCSRSPRVTFYTLVPVVKSEVTEQRQVSPAVSIASVTLPELVNRPQLVTMIDDTRVEILEMYRWAEPLKSSIPRLLAVNLSGLLGTDRVATPQDTPAFEPDIRVSADIRRFASVGNSVSIDAVWSVRNIKDGTAKSGRSEIMEHAAGGYEAIVSAYSRALAILAKDIAQAIKAYSAASR
jgi:uncharacterized lipoprotein YmbA